jgi:hypothetical protein
MDIYSLVAANMRSSQRPAKMDAEAENRYYRDRSGLPLPYTAGDGGVLAAAASSLLALLPRRLRAHGR